MDGWVGNHEFARIGAGSCWTRINAVFDWPQRGTESGDREKKVQQSNCRYPRHKFHRPEGPGRIMTRVVVMSIHSIGRMAISLPFSFEGGALLV